MGGIEHLTLWIEDIEMLRLAPALPFRVRRRPRAAQPSQAIDVPAPQLASQPPIGDWHDLFSAVTETLRSTLGAGSAASTTDAAQETPGQKEAILRECVAALDQLQATLTQEVSRCQQQRLEAQAALAQALDDLAGARDEPLYARYLALHDSVTSLPDHSFFRTRLEQVLAAAAPGQGRPAVLYLGLEGVGAVIDRHGQSVADELLLAVAARLTGSVRADDLVSQFGEHEFACLLLDVPGHAPMSQLACKLFDAVSAPFRIGTLEIIVRPSIGIAVGDSSGADGLALLGRADAAMVRAKRQQLGYAFFDDPAGGTAHNAG